MKWNLNIDFRNVSVVYRRELANYFNTPIGYIFLAVFHVIILLFVFSIAQFWERGRSIDSFFESLRIAYVIFIPTITMRLWAEEKRSGTIEVLFTLPFETVEIILGKYFAALVFLAIALGTTLFLPVTVIYAASPDIMVILGGYLGAFLMGAAYTALGLYLSWLSRDQIIAFLLSFAAVFLLFLMNYHPILQHLGSFKSAVAYLSVSWHFDAMYRGLLDTRDIIYFAGFIFAFLYLNNRAVERSR